MLFAEVIISYIPCVCNKLKIYKRFHPLIYFFAERYIAEARFSAVARPSLIFSVIYSESRFLCLRYSYDVKRLANPSNFKASCCMQKRYK